MKAAERGVIRRIAIVAAFGLGLIANARAGESATSVPEKTVPVFSLLSTNPPGTYWSLQYLSNGPALPPLPFDPFPELEVITLDSTNHIYLINDLSVDYPALNAQLAEESAALNLMLSLEGGGMESLDGGGFGPMSLNNYSAEDLWLEIVCVTNGEAAVILHGVQEGEIYELMSKRELSEPEWNPEQALHTVTNQDWIATTVPMLDRTNALFLWARDWTGLDENTNSMPDWWEFENFGNLNQTDPYADYDDDGHDNYYEWWAGKDPNTIVFSLSATNPYVNSNSSWVQTRILKGVPASMAVLVDSTNFAGATWSPYTSSNIAVNLGTNEGWHEVWVGLRGRLATSEQTWGWRRLKLDYQPPKLAITGPSNTVVQPIIQLQGYCPEALATITCEVSNAAGLSTDVIVLVLDQHYDTNTFEFTTNTFQGFDIGLANGLNTLTLHAADRAGNLTVTNFNFTLDYSNDNNPPVVNLFWPKDGTRVSGTNFTWRGSVDDFTAQLVAQSVGTNSVTNSTAALMERSGNFWIENLPLHAGTNILTLVATDAAGYSSVTNISVVKSDVVLTIYPGTDFTTVGGTINTSNYTVWVNGRKATNYSGGSWSAFEVPGYAGGTWVVQARAIPNSDNGGEGSGASNSGNPDSTQGIDWEIAVDQPMGVFLSSYDEAWQWNYEFLNIVDDFTMQWRNGSGGQCRDAYTDGTTNGTMMLTETWGPNWWPQLVPKEVVETTPNWIFVGGGGGMFAQRCDVNVRDPHTPFPPHSKFRHTAHGLPGLSTGGRAKLGARILIGLGIIAQEILDPQIYLTAGDDPGWHLAAPERITVSGFGPLSSAGAVYALLPAGVEKQLDIQVADADFHLDTVSPGIVTLQYLTVAGATQIGSSTNYAAVKATNAYVIVEAALSSNDTNAAAKIEWSGGESVPGNPFQRRVSKATSARTTVTASLNTNVSVDVWIVWANYTGFNNTGPKNEDSDVEPEVFGATNIIDLGSHLLFANGELLQFKISPTNFAAFTNVLYDIARIKERGTWKKYNGTWSQLSHVGPGDPDGPAIASKDVTPSSTAHIYSTDEPFFSVPVGHDAEEYVYKGSFVERAGVLFSPSSNPEVCSDEVQWHSISWAEWNGTGYQRKAGSNEIAPGAITVGTSSTP